jgi:DNA-directed RNA polymerase specialized sigma24 family protein
VNESHEPARNADQAFSEIGEAIIKIEDPTERARAAGAALKAIPTMQTALRQARQSAVLELRSGGLSHADVATLLGVSRSAAQQIAEGKTSSRKAKPTTEDPVRTGPENPPE